MASTPSTLSIAAALAAGTASRIRPSTPGDYADAASGAPVAPWVAAVGDINGDGLAELVVGAGADDDKDTDAGRVFIRMGAALGGADTTLTTDPSDVIIDGINAGDHAGSAVAAIADLNGNGTGELLIGASGMDNGSAVDAGAAFVLWNPAAGAGIDLGDLTEGAGNGKGFIVWGAAAGDHAGSALASVADLTGDGRAEVLVGATGVDGSRGADQGAVYVVNGQAGDAAVNLASVAAGTGGFRIVGEAAGDAIGNVVAGAGDMNGDGKGEILIGAAAHGATGEGAAYVVFGNNGGAEVDLAQVAAGNGGFRILGAAGDGAGAALSSVGDVNGDGRADLLVGAPGSDSAYVVFGKADGAEVNLAALGSAGFRIRAESAGDLASLSLAGGADLNHDGINDLLIGAAHNAEGGLDAGAVYAVWGGGSTDIDLSLVAQGIGGAKIVGDAGSLFGTAVGLSGDLNGDGSADLVIGAPGVGEAVYTLFTPGDWLPDANLYGTLGDDLITPGFQYGSFTVGEGADTIAALDGDDRVDAGGGDDSIDGGAGADQLIGGAGNDRLDGGSGADLMLGGTGDDTYVVDDLGDVVLEEAGQGTDTVLLQVEGWTATSAMERVELGSGIVGATGSAGEDTLLGNALDNQLKGGAGNDLLKGEAGNDQLDGGSGADTLAGGTGDDTYFVDDVADLVLEIAGEGNDTVVASFDMALPDNVENMRLTGSAHQLTGNAGNNTLSGNSGNDTLDGGAGDDTLLAGDGDDVLVATAGTDTLSGGSGDDTYKVHGASAYIEDFLGHDTLDASEASGDSHIDLSGETVSRVEDKDCDFGHGGSSAAPLDLQFLQDLSGSFGDDIANVQTLVPQIVTALRAVQANSQFGVSSFIDKPALPFGSAGEWVYKQELALTANETQLSDTYNNLVILNGDDEPEAQIEGLMQLALHATDVGFRADSARFVVLFTDAPYHSAGDGVQAGITTPNNGDAVADGGGIGEDYPLIPQVQAALQAANIIPIFAIANGYESVYSGLVTALGRGTVVTLSADSSNVVAAITAGLTVATTTRIEDAIGGAGNDTLKGDFNANRLVGNAGNDNLAGGDGSDTLEGGRGNDALQGDAGDDVAVIAGTRTNHSVVLDAATGAVIVSDLDASAAGSGTDALSGLERVRFDDGTFTMAQLLGTVPTNTAPTGSASAVLADGSEDQAYTVTTAQLLQGFSDADGDALAASGLSSDHGSVVDNGDGTFTITPSADYHGPVTLSYSVTDGRGGSIAATLGLNLAAVNDGPAGSASAALADGTQDQAYTVTAAQLLEGFSDVDGDTLAVDGLVSSTGSVADNGDGSYTVTPGAGYRGAVELSYSVIDGQGGSAAASLGFTLAAVNTAPAGSATAVLADGSEDQAYTVTATQLLQGFSDVDGDSLSIQGLTSSNGSVVDNGDGSFTLSPSADFNGSVTLSYSVTDGRGGSTAATLGLSLAAVNDGPTGSATSVLAAGSEDLAYTVTTAQLLQGFSDVDGDVLSIQGLASSNGSVQANGDGSFTITPSTDFNGAVTLNYSVIDGQGGSSAASLGYSLAAVNDTPALTWILPMLSVGFEDQPYTVSAGTLLSAWSDVDGDALQVVGLSANHGSAQFDAATGLFTITPEANYNGWCTLSYGVSDGSATSPATLDFRFMAVNDAPTGSATAVLASGTQGSAYTVSAASLLQGFSDVDGDTLAVSGLASSQGTVVDNGNGSFTIQPAAGYSAAVALSYSVVDGHGGSTAASQSFQLAPLNTLSAGNDTLLLTRGQPSALDAAVLLANDSSSAGAALSVSAVSNAVGASVALVGGQLVINASAASGGFDYTLHGADGSNATGHVAFSAASTNSAANTVSAAAGMAAADLQGQGGNDTLRGSAGADNLNGGSGNDQLFGNDGNDRLSGGDGNDLLDGGAGTDAMTGGAGNDTYVVDQAGDTVSEAAGGGSDTVRTSLASYTLGAAVEDLVYTGSGNFNGSGNALANSLSGGAGNDRLDGGAGSDQMNGGLGNDTYVVDASGDNISDSGGLDTVLTTLSSYTLASAIENLFYTGSGSFNGSGNNADNLLAGGAGNDRLDGGRGNDTLLGGGGADSLTGGLGADIFRFDALSDLGVTAATTDRIQDFRSAQGDRIDLSRLDANSLLSGDQAFNFIGNAAFSHQAGELRMATSGGNLTLTCDINGDGNADFALQLMGVMSLIKNDLVP